MERTTGVTKALIRRTSRRLFSFHEPTQPRPLSRGAGIRLRRAGFPPGGFRSGFMVPMHGIKIVRAFLEPHEFSARAPLESGGGPPHSKTLARWPRSRALPPGFGVRRPCSALVCPDRFMVPMHGIKVVGAFHGPPTPR